MISLDLLIKKFMTGAGLGTVPLASFGLTPEEVYSNVFHPIFEEYDTTHPLTKRAQIYISTSSGAPVPVDMAYPLGLYIRNQFSQSTLFFPDIKVNGANYRIENGMIRAAFPFYYDLEYAAVRQLETSLTNHILARSSGYKTAWMGVIPATPASVSSVVFTLVDWPLTTDSNGVITGSITLKTQASDALLNAMGLVRANLTGTEILTATGQLTSLVVRLSTNMAINGNFMVTYQTLLPFTTTDTWEERLVTMFEVAFLKTLGSVKTLSQIEGVPVGVDNDTLLSYAREKEAALNAEPTKTYWWKF